MIKRSGVPSTKIFCLAVRRVIWRNCYGAAICGACAEIESVWVEEVGCDGHPWIGAWTPGRREGSDAAELPRLELVLSGFERRGGDKAGDGEDGCSFGKHYSSYSQLPIKMMAVIGFGICVRSDSG